MAYLPEQIFTFLHRFRKVSKINLFPFQASPQSPATSFRLKPQFILNKNRVQILDGVGIGYWGY